MKIYIEKERTNNGERYAERLDVQLHIQVVGNNSSGKTLEKYQSTSSC